ncbi:hypothetical protein F5Y00DRAFT_237891 [Daldinia vernicosa]|uniref:uncharacterized protein n=1 Tax=Daldinia vernicosa TaxID=114800 RepID=UPI002008125B|nr:uncharacterized protein F5Y00DRAFT_237891 [Daldinia vernicosa]KAI0848616.1 hypothetical protein F5Y00DRAFT_237891 [Daldinia vernicosa]
MLRKWLRYARNSYEPASKTLFVRLDRSKVFSHGLPSLSRMMTQVHIWHCMADSLTSTPADSYTKR